MCADEVSDEDETKDRYGRNRIGEPIQPSGFTIAIRHISLYLLDIDLSFPPIQGYLRTRRLESRSVVVFFI